MTPVDFFHENIFVAVKAIPKGAVIKADWLERENYEDKDMDTSKVIEYPNIQVVGSVAKNNIAKGQLIGMV